MVLIGEFLFYIGCTGIGAILTRISLCRCCFGNRNEEPSSSEPLEHDYILLDEDDEEIPSRSFSLEYNGFNPNFIDLFSPGYEPIFNNDEVIYNSRNNPLIERSKPLLRFHSESIENDDIAIDFLPYYSDSSDSDDDNEGEEEKQMESTSTLDSDSGAKSEEEIEEQKTLATALDLDATVFDSESVNLYYAKEFYFGLAMKKSALNNASY